MKQKKVGNALVITFTYLEWVAGGKVLPAPEAIEIDGKVKYVIKDVPEDLEKYFTDLGIKVVLAVSKGKGMRRW